MNCNITNPVFLTLLSLGFISLGCSSHSYLLVDRTGLEVDLKKINLTQEKYFEVLDGESYRQIPIEAVEKMTIDPSVTYSYRGKLYYQTAILLIDGTQIKPRSAKSGKIKSFVCIENSIYGEGPTGEVFLNLEDLNMVRKIEPI